MAASLRSVIAKNVRISAIQGPTPGLSSQILTSVDFPAGPGGYNLGFTSFKLSGNGNYLFAYQSYIEPSETATVYRGAIFELNVGTWVPLTTLPNLTYSGVAVQYGPDFGVNNDGTRFAFSPNPTTIEYYSRTGNSIASQGTVSLPGSGLAFPATVSMSADGLRLVAGRQTTNWALRSYTRINDTSSFTQFGSDMTITDYRGTNNSGGSNYSPRSSVAMSSDGNILFVSEGNSSANFGRYTWNNSTPWILDTQINPQIPAIKPGNSFFNTMANGTKLAYSAVISGGYFDGTTANVNTSSDELELISNHSADGIDPEVYDTTGSENGNVIVFYDFDGVSEYGIYTWFN